MIPPIKYRKRKATRITGGTMHDWDAEEGDLCILQGKLFRLVESRGHYKAAAGELTMIQIKPPHPDMTAERIGDEIWWKDTAGVR